MSIIQDMIMVQKSILKKSSKSFIKSWPIIFTGIAYTIINMVALLIINKIFAGVLSIVAGLVTAIISSSLISSYLYLLFNIVNYDRITFSNFKEGFSQYLWKVYGVFFIAWLASYLLSAISRILGNNAGILMIILGFAAFILLNALPETIYQKYYSPGESIKYAFEFIKENWLNWFLPNIILFGGLYLLTGSLILDIFTTHISFNFDFSIEGLARYIIGQSIFSFAMIYRGHLFKLLSTSTRRKRAFMNKLYD